MTPSLYLWLLPLFPLAGFAINGILGRRLPKAAVSAVALLFPAAAFVQVLWIVARAHQGLALPYLERFATPWIAVTGFHANFSFLLDQLTLVMLLVVTGVGLVIHLYSVGYMAAEDGYWRFFSYMNLFLFFMLTLVLAANFLLMFVGWEGVGLVSYLLIGFYYTKDSAANAGKKAFIVNRIGDFGFLLAMFLLIAHFGTLSFREVFANISAHPDLQGGFLTAIALLLLLGATGKSAQIPLYVWLPDAMEGPTPVSALIHAATMVTAGVYLMCRVNPLLHASGAASLTIAIVGAATAFVAATIACAQSDIKKVLAYSTVSQLGYMFLAVGTGAYEAALFLMIAHAFFKGLLFLGAGSVIHGLHDEQDLKRMGNLRRYMKVTFYTFAVAWLAIAGVPPLSGFWAKGDVLDNAFARYPALWVVGLAAALLTAYYLSRLVALAFFGDDRWRTDNRPAGHGHGGSEPHESPWPMKVPLVILAILALAGGALSFPWYGSGTLLRWVDPVFGANLYDAHQSVGLQWGLAITDSAVAVVGVVLGFALWNKVTERPALENAFLRRSWYLNELYDSVIGRPGARLAAFTASTVEGGIIDGAVNGIASAVRRGGGLVRRAQTGYVRNYALGIVLGVVVIFGFMLTRVWWS